MLKIFYISKKLRLKNLFVFIFVVLATYSQNGFQIAHNKTSYKMPFELNSNLIILDVTLNDVPMKFILDTGVDKTVMFSLENVDSIQFINLEKIILKGLGNDDPIEAYVSLDNKLQVGKLFDNQHKTYVILDQNINFSSRLGVSINGVIGYDFFKNFVVDINYNTQTITVFNKPSKRLIKKLKNYNKESIQLINNKPFLDSDITIGNTELKGQMLLDLGNSDGFWIFSDNDFDDINCFDDFLGKGFSGDIYGSRCRAPKIVVNNQIFVEPIFVKPDTESIQNVILNNNRIGSFGGNYLKRFHTIWDYKNKVVYFRKNKKINEPFEYNMSGMVIQQEGAEWQINNSTKRIYTDKDLVYSKNITDLQNLRLVPVYKIVSVNKESEPYQKGVREGDQILSINDKKVSDMSLNEINALFRKQEGKKIVMNILSNQTSKKISFKLKRLI